MKKAFQEQYKHFQDKRNLVFKLAPKKTPDESNSQFTLRLTRWYEPQKRSGSDVDQTFEDARSAGRSFMSTVFSDPIFIINCKQYFLDEGYANLMNVYLFTAPLDALNWKVMKAPQFNDISFNDWSAVVGLNDAAKDIHGKFLKEYVCIRHALILKELSDDPFPSDDSADVKDAIFNSILPKSIEKNVENVRSYF